MAELIEKPTMLNWVQKQIEAVTKKQVAGSDGIFTREVLTTMQRDLSTFENAINAMPTTTEAEIRAKAISDFLKALEELTQKNWIDHLEYGITWADLEEVAEQLKEE